MSLAVARRYARALAEVAFEQKAPPAELRRRVMALKEQVAALAGLLREHAALRNALVNPAVAREEKQAVLKRLAERLRLSRPAHNFFALLVDNRRLDLLPVILAALDAEFYQRLGIVPVEVTTAAALTAGQKKELESRLRALTSSEVEVRFAESPEILGGGIVRLGSTIYDGSLRAQLRRLQAQLASE
jgi:F-type H+-transporting ATPase subunit delta